jgi:hypothetical protein
LNVAGKKKLSPSTKEKNNFMTLVAARCTRKINIGSHGRCNLQINSNFRYNLTHKRTLATDSNVFSKIKSKLFGKKEQTTDQKPESDSKTQQKPPPTFEQVKNKLVQVFNTGKYDFEGNNYKSN